MALIFPIDVDLRDAISRLRVPHGAEDYSSLSAMQLTWRDRSVPIPTEAELQAALNAIAAERAAKASAAATDSTERSNAETALTALATIRDRVSWTNAQRDNALQIFARVLIWIIRRELKR